MIVYVRNITNVFMTKPIVATVLASVALSITTGAYACKLPKSYYKNVSCTADSRYFLAEKDSGLPVALIARNGKPVADLSRYAQVDASKLRSGIMPVERRGKVGYVNTSGQEVVPTVYDMLADDPKTNGWARKVSNNRIIVRKGGAYGVITPKNQIIVPFSSSYRTISNFKNGKAQVYKRNGTSWIAKNGKAIRSPNSSSQGASQSNDLAGSASNSNSVEASIISAEVWQPKQREDKWGFVDRNDEPMIRFTFDAVMPFAEGLAGVQTNGNWGFVDLSGALTIPFRFDEKGVVREGVNNKYRDVAPFVFTQGKAWIGNLNDGSKLCIDKDGTNLPCDSTFKSAPTLTAVSSKPAQASANIDSAISPDVDKNTKTVSAIQHEYLSVKPRTYPKAPVVNLIESIDQ